MITRLKADEAARDKFYHFFGLIVPDRYPLSDFIKELFPDTAVSVLKECFEALQLYDLTELLEKVRPRSLRPALFPEQVEKLWRTDDRPTRYHSNVAVLVVNRVVEGDDVKRDSEEKIEAFFKGLSPRNEVAIISSPSSQETREAREEDQLEKRKEEIRHQLKVELPLRRKRLKKQLEMKMEKEDNARVRLFWSRLQEEELLLRLELDNCIEESTKLREQLEKNIEKVEEQEKKAVSTAMDKLIHNQGWLTS